MANRRRVCVQLFDFQLLFARLSRLLPRHLRQLVGKGVSLLAWSGT
jgi:hypothetical protein